MQEAWREARWLAAKEIRRTWLSYPATGLFVLFFAFAVTGLIGGTLSAAGVGEPSESRTFGAYYVDVFFLAFGSLLAGNYVSRDYLSSWSDSFSRRLSFLRSLPISARGIAAARALTMLPALALTVPAFFLPAYVVSGALASRLSTIEYLLFAAVWVGYGLLCAGLFLYLELGLHGKTYNWIALGVTAFLIFVFWPVDWLLDLRIVSRTVGLVEAHGVLPAAVALLIGIAAFALLTEAAARRIGRRDLSRVKEDDGLGARVPVRISMDDPEPMYRQIEDQLRDLIISGRLPAGAKLPSVRALARDLACSVITTRRSYQDLENEGLIRTRQGMGTVVAEIGAEKRKSYRLESISNLLWEAVQAGTRVGFSPDELRELFEEALGEAGEGGVSER